jgi:pre-mRNA cleavage complex 2 protein Pcf11
MRFHDSAEGKKRMEEHLDMHFRQNRKANQNVGRGHNRSWFTALDVRVFSYIHDCLLIDVFLGLDPRHRRR